MPRWLSITSYPVCPCRMIIIIVFKYPDIFLGKLHPCTCSKCIAPFLSILLYVDFSQASKLTKCHQLASFLSCLSQKGHESITVISAVSMTFKVVCFRESLCQPTKQWSKLVPRYHPQTCRGE